MPQPAMNLCRIPVTSMLARLGAAGRGRSLMRELEERCAAMAADMLDAELLAIIRKVVAHDGMAEEQMTPLQVAVLDELRKRAIPF